jgi:hypothetical protein
MNGLTQMRLSQSIAKQLDDTVKAYQATPQGCLFFLVSLAWGWARRHGLSSNDFLEICRKQAIANEALEAKALRIDPTRPV